MANMVCVNRFYRCTFLSKMASRSACIFSLDDSYILPFRVFFHSLCASNSIPKNCALFVLHTNSLSPESILLLQNFIGQYGFEIHFRDASDVIPSNLPIGERDHVSLSTFYRLFVAEILPQDVEHAVYLDSDMIVLRSIRELFYIELDEPSLLAAVDHCAPAQGLRMWGAIGGGYFQAGVLVIPIKRWRERLLSSAFVQAMHAASDKIQWWDQDVLNLVIANNWTRLPIWFNVCHSHLALLEQPEIEERAYIIHYSGAHKPWNAYAASPLNHLWDSAYESLFGSKFDRMSLRPPRFPRYHYYRSRLFARIYREH